MEQVRTADVSVFNVKSFGASGVGDRLATESLQQAIDACAAAGGGMVYFPAGIYLSGTLLLKSNVNIHLEAGATLLGSDDIRHYHKPAHLRFGVDDVYSLRANQLLYGRKVDNVSITGQGVINCRAREFFAQMEAMKRADEQHGKPWTMFWGPDEFASKQWRPRSTIHLFCCRNIHIEGITLVDDGNSAMQIVGCSMVTVNRVKIYDPEWLYTDGIEVHASNHVMIQNCYIETCDDPIAIYQSINIELEEVFTDEELRDHPNEYITVSHCMLKTRCNVRINGARGGVIRHVLLDHVVVEAECSLWGAENCGILIYNWHTGEFGCHDEMPQLTEIEDITFSNVTVRAPHPVMIRGEDFVGKATLGHAGIGNIRNVTFTNCRFDCAGSVILAGAEDLRIEHITFDNVRFNILEKVQPSSMERNVPYPFDWPYLTSVLYCRYVDGLQLHNVEFVRQAEHAHHWTNTIRCDGVSQLRLEHVSIRQVDEHATEHAAIALQNVARAVIQNCIAQEGMEVFLELSGPETRGITLLANDLTEAKTVYRAAEEVKADALRCVGNLT